MECRMKQRGISEDIIGTIMELGEWNERGDRIVLSEKNIKKLVLETEKNLRVYHKLARRGGASIVLDGEAEITAFWNTKRMQP
ncbi:hypothetical protein N9A67_06935 [Rhodobacteraceae bacterium]|nr:hypothetical protein [Paracoccaceae bacterium]